MPRAALPLPSFGSGPCTFSSFSRHASVPPIIAQLKPSRPGDAGPLEDGPATTGEIVLRQTALLRLLERGLEISALRLALVGEDGARGAVFPLLARLLLQAGWERHVPGLLHILVEIVEVEVDERLDGLVLLESVRADIDE